MWTRARDYVFPVPDRWLESLVIRHLHLHIFFNIFCYIHHWLSYFVLGLLFVSPLIYLSLAIKKRRDNCLDDHDDISVARGPIFVLCLSLMAPRNFHRINDSTRQSGNCHKVSEQQSPVIGTSNFFPCSLI